VPKSCWRHHRHKESPLNWTRQEQFELEKSSLDGMHAELFKYRLQVIVYLKPAETYPHLRYVFVSFFHRMRSKRQPLPAGDVWSPSWKLIRTRRWTRFGWPE
jgi:hypothetical protein